MPQPRIHPSAAARQRAYRRRTARPSPQPVQPVQPTGDDANEWRKFLSDIGLSMKRGTCLTDAPQGKGRLLTGQDI